MKDQTLNAVNKVRYLGIIIKDDLCDDDDDDDQQHQTCKNYAQAHMLVGSFHVKIALFKA